MKIELLDVLSIKSEEKLLIKTPKSLGFTESFSYLSFIKIASKHGLKPCSDRTVEILIENRNHLGEIRIPILYPNGAFWMVSYSNYFLLKHIDNYLWGDIDTPFIMSHHHTDLLI